MDPSYNKTFSYNIYFRDQIEWSGLYFNLVKSILKATLERTHFDLT